MPGGTAPGQTGCLTSPMEKTVECVRVYVCPLVNFIPDQPEGRNSTEPSVLFMYIQVLFLWVLVTALL